MSYPIITRLGINQFWYRHWYTDKLYSSSINQDFSIKLLLKTFLKYGLYQLNNIFIHEYWYNKKFKTKRYNKFFIQNTIFFRRFYFSNNIVGVEHSYLIRKVTPEYFPMKLWLFRYNNWVIISWHWFKPQKTNKKKI